MGDAKLIFIVIFMVIALIRAIRNSAQERPQGQQADAEAAAKRRRVQSDIDAFLTEVGASPAPKQTTEPPTPAPQRARRQESAAKRRQAGNRRRPPRPQERQRQQATARQPKDSPPITERALGSGISEHVDQYIAQHVAEHVDSNVDDHLEVDIAHSVSSHLGDRSAELPSLTQAGVDVPTTAENFRQLLRSRQGVRQAILLNEILTRPRALRH